MAKENRKEYDRGSGYDPIGSLSNFIFLVVYKEMLAGVLVEAIDHVEWHIGRNWHFS
jgi:hypothetical protein